MNSSPGWSHRLFSVRRLNCGPDRCKAWAMMEPSDSGRAWKRSGDLTEVFRLQTFPWVHFSRLSIDVSTHWHTFSSGRIMQVSMNLFSVLSSSHFYSIFTRIHGISIGTLLLKPTCHSDCLRFSWHPFSVLGSHLWQPIFLLCVSLGFPWLLLSQNLLVFYEFLSLEEYCSAVTWWWSHD